MNDLMSTPIEGIVVRMNEDNVADVQAEIHGPEQTPYHGGFFRMRLIVESDFPRAPPRGKARRSFDFG